MARDLAMRNQATRGRQVLEEGTEGNIPYSVYLYAFFWALAHLPCRALLSVCQPSCGGLETQKPLIDPTLRTAGTYRITTPDWFAIADKSVPLGFQALKKKSRMDMLRVHAVLICHRRIEEYRGLCRQVLHTRLGSCT
jgi:hypothetical protein